MPLSLPSVKRKARIEIIPLIDIVFFLLATFVMVSLSMVQNQGVAVRLPSAATGEAQAREGSVTVSFTEAGEVYLNKQNVPPAELQTKLQALKAQNPDVKVFIQGDEGARFGQAVELLDGVRQLGITKVAIQTRNKT